jgi:hypothetical protein
MMTFPVILSAALGLIVAATSTASAQQGYQSAADYGGPPAEQQYPWRGGSTKDDGYPVPQPPRADYAPPRHVAPACLSTVELRDALNHQGWHAFSDVERRGSMALMSARSDRGRRYDLQVDNCTGNVIEAHPVVVYTEPPEVYYDRRPSVGVFIGGGGHHGRHGRW